MSNQKNLQKAAAYYLKKGINVIATGSTKRAIFSWKIYQNQLITKEEIEIQLNNPNAKGLAVICGAVSGGLEVIDLDLKYDISGNLYDRLLDECPALKNLYSVKTKSGGYHFYYFCEQIEGNQKLANRPATDKEKKDNPHVREVVLIETRSEGGYVIAPPTEGYEIHNRKEIDVISIEQRDIILSACRSFNEVVNIIDKPNVIEKSTNKFHKNCWDDYNERSNPIELLERHGWSVVSQKSERTVFKRPGTTESKSSGDYHHGLKLFKVFTTSSQFEPNKGYTPYALYTLLEHNGNYSESAKQLIKDGYGERLKEYNKDITSKIKTGLNNGLSKDSIIGKLTYDHNLSVKDATIAVDHITKLDAENIGTFWDVTPTKTKPIIEIMRARLVQFLEDNGFHLYFYDEKTNIFRFVRQSNGFVTEETSESIKKFIFDYVCKLPDSFDGIDQESLLQTIINGSDKYFSKNSLEWLKRADIDFLKDDYNNAYFPFKNGVVKVDKDGSKLLTYSEVGKVIWRSQVIDFNIDVDMDFDFALCEFYKFMCKVCGDDEEKLLYLITIIGYLLHQYKDPSRPFAIILAEETEDEKKGGGAGKGILVKALQSMSNIERVDGKNFKLDKNFAFQRVGIDTKIIAIEDVRKNVDFEGFYSIITEGITIEKKNQDELFLPYKDSPKIMFTTNYTISSVGGHAKRRQRVFEFSNFFNSNNSPLDYFGHKLFDDWDLDEWNRFYNLFFTCVSLYLNNGVKEYANGEKLNRKHIKLSFGEEFLFWFDEQKDLQYDTHKPFKELYNNFLGINDYDKKDYSQKRFKKALEETCERFGYELNERKNIQTRTLELKIIKI